MIIFENPNERLAHFIEHLQMTVTRFEKETGTSISSIARFIKGNDLGIKTLVRISNRFPQLNIDWLITGRGEMLVAPDSLSETELAEHISQLKRIVGYLEDTFIRNPSM
ncbi:helix-turn-helix domain-containing protein [Rudanella paleaurantiibacter]|uniref:Helix-turn-helix domain-containing protein n=1 Tax=Rudanella paleaurantiibacter TaxID=2614655 RepID=A0A7J5TRW7_9BACT|nr:helix-turn-helix transcriptional regulator [Rudanella paleaurantiibacter]KAB7725489.1 helix-turn-helix domain-containing protein [Rudanella paleaurantiibacter]